MVKNDKELSLWEHGEELLKRLRIIAISIIVCSCVVAFFPADLYSLFSLRGYNPIVMSLMRAVQNDLLPDSVSLIAGGFIDAIWAYLILSLFLGVALSSPVIAHQLFQFVNSALFQSERKHLFLFVFSFVSLFLFGVLFAYYLLIPLTFKIMVYFIEASGSLQLIYLRDFITLTVLFTIITGLLFALPVYVVILVKFDILTPKNLASNRKNVYIGLAILLAILTPDPSPISLIMVMIPMIILFEASILAGRMVQKPQK